MGTRTSARENMMLSAVTLFRERGVDATSLADVIDHAHAPRGSIYHHFPGGKPQLAEEATRRAGGYMGSMISVSLADGEPAQTLTLIVDVFRQQLLDTDYAAGCPVAAGALEGGEYPAAKQAAGEAFTSWESTIAAALWQRGVRMSRAQSVATLSIAALEGALLLAKAQRSTQALDRVATELTAVVDDAIEDATSTSPRRGR
jgi:AcrR family transcriptional regulator